MAFGTNVVEHDLNRAFMQGPIVAGGLPRDERSSNKITYVRYLT